MKRKAIILLFTFLFSIPVIAQLDRTKMPEPGPAPEIELGEYESFQLDNGLKVFVVENNKLPRVAFNLVLDLDPIVEGENAGYVTTAGQLLRTGTTGRTKDEIDEAVDFIGASLNTSPDGVYGASLTKHIDKLLDLMSDIVKNANFTQAELDKIKKQTISGLASQKDDPNAIAGRVKNALLYGLDHPYGEQMTEETVESITLDMCKDYYNNYFSPSVAYLAIVGDINVDDAEDLVKKYFSDWTVKEVPAKEYKTPRAPLIRKVAVVDRPNAVQSVIHIAYPVKLMKGSEDVIKANVMNTILGGSFSSRLNQNLRETHAYTYGARSSINSDELIGSFDASCEARNSVTDSVVTQFLEEMQKLRNEKVSQEELDMVINYMSGGFARSLESPQTIANFAINTELYNLPKDYYKNYLKNLSAVTVEDVEAMAKKYLQPNKAYVLVVGNAGDVADNLKQFSPAGKVDYYDIYGGEYDPNVKELPAGLTVDDVINKYIEVIGGRENIEKVVDRTTKMKGQVQTFEINVTISQKVPNMYYFNLDAGVMKQEQKFDGERAVVTGMGGSELEGEQLEAMKIESIMHSYLDYSKYGITPELVSMEAIDGKDAYKVVLNLPTGKTKTEYYDAETGYKVREVSVAESPQGTFTSTVDYSDYKEVEGVMYPHKISQQMGPQNIEMEVISVEVNTGLSDELFKVK
ncbi:MAG: insulinase family protein [Candidatus Cloacimonetes bacterium]|nr:insulinase family protein [Candidatus Cloacimonadota bacterium]